MIIRTFFAAAILAFSTAPLAAQTVLSGDHSVVGNLCVGLDCTASETFVENLKLKDNNNEVFIDDTSSLPNFPANDWRFRFNDFFQFGENYFAISDATAGNDVFKIEAGAPASALFVSTDGDIGLGTSLPQAKLHLLSGEPHGVRFEMDSSQGFTPQIWELWSDNISFSLINRTFGSNRPIQIQTEAPDNTLYLANSGNVGLGTSAPAAPLEIVDDDTFSFFRITATGAPINQSVDIVFTKGPANTGQLRYNIVDGDGPEMRLNANGDMTLTGTLTTAGPECNMGCDRLFAPDFALASIEDHAAAMWSKGYLPALGPTVPGAPLNVTDKLGDVINELEHAHIYFAQLQADLRAKHARSDALEVAMQDIHARLDAMESAAD